MTRMASQNSQLFHWHYSALEDKNFQVHGRGLLLIFLFAICLLFTLLCLYTRWFCRYRQLASPTNGPPRASAVPASAKSVGLNPIAIDSLPIYAYRPTAEDGQCSICLSYYQAEEKVKVLPECQHGFHPDCVDMWLKAHSSCPLCRAALEAPSLEKAAPNTPPTELAFDGLAFLLKMRGKTVMFVGDSIGRNQWLSLVCMLYSAVPNSQTQLIRGDPLSTINFLDYGVSVSYYKARYLVDIDEVQGKRILKLDDISGNANAWKGADVLSFNSGHWWIHNGAMKGWDYMETGGTYYPDMDRLVAFEKAMRTWAQWVDMNVDRTKTSVFFLGISPTHYNPSEWSSPVSKNCYGEKEPVSGWTYAGAYPNQVRVVQTVVGEMKSPVYLLDITLLSELRKDAHPSIYSGDLSSQQRANPDRSADCSHWCLPGLPDTWNQLFYTVLFF